ncbi:MAG: hypothetical protein IH965_15140 [Gemmatimonadetes bacterium]|nr:hypothetical protein [Gemmatimonadota bacterium]
MRAAWGRYAIVVLAAVGIACENAGEGRVLAVQAMGTVVGTAVFDGNGSGEVDSGDSPFEGLRVRLVVKGTLDTVAVVTADAQGAYSIERLPVGTYEILVDSASAGDTVEVVLHDSTEVTVRPDITVAFTVAVSFPSVDVTGARALVPGTKVFLEGVALVALGAFGDTTIHVRDAGAAIRATRVQFQPVAPGDSVRLLGRRSSRDGQPTLDNVTVFPLGLGVVQPPERISTLAASSADAGRLDAALVKVVNATVSDTTTRQSDFVVTADDGSGPLEIVFDIDAGLTIPTITFPDSVTQATVMDVTGVLVPNGSSVWLLKPRVNADVIER